VKKNAPRVKPLEEVIGEKSFALRANLPGVTARYVGANDVVLTANGVEVASKTTIYKRGKVVTVLYVFPSLDAYRALFALPVGGA
jgi:hypothetical protein